MSREPSRRAFLARAMQGVGAGLAMPYVLASAALGAAGKAPASDRVATGHIGVGGRGGGLLRHVVRLPSAMPIAVCDIDQNRLAGARRAAGGNARTYHDFRELLEAKDIDAVVVASPDHWHPLHTIHACKAGKDVYCEKPLSVTVLEGQRMVEAARRHGTECLVFSSSAAVYGPPDVTPIPEDHPHRPISPYGYTKSAFERVLSDFAAAYPLRSISLRYFNAAGADMAGRAGERHDPETHLIPIVLQHLRGQRDHIYVFGTDYPTHDGSCIRDYIHINDLAAAHVLAVEALAEGAETTRMNVGTGEGCSVLQVIAAAERVTGIRADVIEAERREGDPPVLVADPSRITEALGWQPQHSSLEPIIESAWKWETR